MSLVAFWTFLVCKNCLLLKFVASPFFALCEVVADKTLIPFVCRFQRGAFEMYLSSEIAPNVVNTSETFVA